MVAQQTPARCPNCGAPSVAEELCDRCKERSSGERTGSWAPSAASLQGKGVVLEGKYRLLEELGRGGMGTVFRAVDESLDRIVAVKFLLPELQSDEHLGERFRREAKAMASVRHENVLQIFAFGAYGSTPFFVMEHIEGVTVERLLENATKQKVYIPIDRVLSILDQAACGLAAVHRAGVVHRDVKPANIMVESETGRAVIMDFGIGKRYHDGETRRTQTPAGSPAYMAPEVASGQQISSEEDHLSDIYAFGVTAFELLTNSLPFDSQNWVDILVKKVSEPPPRVGTRRCDLQLGVDEIVSRCLATSPRDRYQSFTEVQRALAPLVCDGTPRRALTPVPERSEGRKRPTPSTPGRPTPSTPGRPTSSTPGRPTSSTPGRPTSSTPGRPTSSTPSRPTREEPRPRPKRNGGPAVRVIVADQDLCFTKMAFEKVEEAFPGNRFLATKTNSKALDLALTTPPLLMVAPLDDPDLNGLELAAALRGNPELKDVFLVLTCERVTAGERRMLLELGAFKIILKPVDPDEFSILLDCVAQRQPHPTPPALARGQPS
jgi:serine/threonine protein kinase